MIEENFIGEAGGGMVKVHISSNLNIIQVEIDKTVFANSMPKILEDLNFMSDLFKAATNAAIDKAMNNKVEAITKIPFEQMLGNLNGK